MTESAPPLLRSSAPMRFSVALLLTVVAALGFACLFLVARRLSGALTAPLEFLPALAIGAVIALASWLLRYTAERLDPPQSQRLILAITVLTWATVAAVTLLGTSPLAVLALWLPVIAGEAAWRIGPRHVDATEQGSRGAGERRSRGEDEQGRELPPDVVQQLTRVRRDGVEMISAVAHLEFAPQEQTAALHLAFCPPLVSDPQITVECEDFAVTARATECRSYGVRIEGKRRDASAAVSVRVRVEARAS